MLNCTGLGRQDRFGGLNLGLCKAQIMTLHCADPVQLLMRTVCNRKVPPHKIPRFVQVVFVPARMCQGPPQNFRPIYFSQIQTQSFLPVNEQEFIYSSRTQKKNIMVEF